MSFKRLTLSSPRLHETHQHRRSPSSLGATAFKGALPFLEHRAGPGQVSEEPRDSGRSGQRRIIEKDKGDGERGKKEGWEEGGTGGQCSQHTLHTSAKITIMNLQSRSHLRVRQNRGTPQGKWKKTAGAPGQLKSTDTFKSLTPTGLLS